MRLISVTFNKYNRFNLNPRMRNCIIEPSKPIIIVAGDNGSGKSSLCSTLFPWPIDKSNLDVGGMVSRTWEHNNSIYIDEYANGQYSLTKDGEELNTSGGLRVQESLFTECFGVDAATMRLLTGETRFTSMTVKQRQYWMSRLDGHQLEKLEAVVLKLKELKKEKDILLQYNNGQLGKYQVNDDYDDLLAKRDALKIKLDEMFSSRVNVPTHPEEYKQVICSLKEEARRNVIYKKALRTELRYVKDIHIDSLNEQLTTAKLLRQVKVDRLMSISQPTISIEGLPSQEECLAYIAQCTDALFDVPTDYDDPNAYNKWLYVSSDIYRTLDTLSDLEHLLMVEESDVIAKLVELDKAILTTANEISRLEENIRLAIEDMHNPLTCPKCSTVFGKHLGAEVSQAHIDNASHRLHQLKEEYSTYQQHKTEANQLLANVQLSKRAKEHVVLKLNDLLPELGTLVMADIPNLAQCRTYLTSAVAALEQSNVNARLKADIDKYNGYIALHTKFAQQLTDSAAIEARKLEEEITELDTHITSLTKLIQDKLKYNSIVAHSEATTKKILDICTNTLPAALQSIVLSGLNEAITMTALDLRQELNSLVHQLSIYEANKAHHLSVTEAIDTLSSELTHINEALAILDGKKGFIGTMYKERSQQHIEALNMIISGLFSQDMNVLLPPEAMTFRFPISIEGTTREDVSCGSKGMQEIIDIAFCLLVRQTCHISHLPLILDEVGSALDAGNLDKTYSFLLNCPVDQLVLVSHLAEIQNVLGDDQADYIVLSSMNLAKYTLPSTTNSCLTFT